MSEDWKVGDLALCVRGGPMDNRDFHQTPISGKLYPVTGLHPDVNWSDGDKDLGLMLEGAPLNFPINVWWHGRFRKINPLTDEETRYALRELETDKAARCPLTGEPLTVQERFESECG